MEFGDPNRSNARQDLHEMLVTALCAMLCGGEDCTDMALFGEAKEDFLRQFMKLPHGIPSMILSAGCSAISIREAFMPPSKIS